MNTFICWSTAILVIVAAVVDLRTRRIPNRLVVPFLLAGMVVSTLAHGFKGLGGSLAGIAVAALALGLFVCRGGLGMGDLKLAAAVGAWIGPSQLGFALIATSLAGGAMALAALRKPGARSIAYAPAIAAGTIFSFFAS